MLHFEIELGEPKGNTVSDFSKWVMSRYQQKIYNPEAMQRGKYVERSIARLAKPSVNTEWKLIYRDPLEEKPTPLEISSLTYEGKSLWGAPDLVYKNIRTNEIIIVERKASDKEVPIDGWPNLRAQLWAYGHIDIFSSAELITLVGEVWNEIEGKIIRRCVLRWSLTDTDFYNENLELFNEYGGKLRA